MWLRARVAGSQVLAMLDSSASASGDFVGAAPVRDVRGAALEGGEWVAKAAAEWLGKQRCVPAATTSAPPTDAG